MRLFTITIAMKDVAEGDATSLAQRIWDENAADFDAARGEFVVRVLDGRFDTGWEPES